MGQERKVDNDVNLAKQQEIDSISDWIKRVQEKGEDSDIPIAISLLDIGRGIVTEKTVMVERGARVSRENWLFVLQAKQPQDIKEILPAGLRQTVQGLALRIEVSEDTVLDAAIKTKVLMDNFNNGKAVFLEFGKESEGLRLMSSYLVDLRTKQAMEVGYMLEYYSSFDTVENEKLLSLLTHSELRDVNFAALFPYLLIYSTHIESKKQIENL